MHRTVIDSSHLKKLLTVIALAIFIDSLDGSIVNIALPTIAEGFSVDMSTEAWVIMAYFLFLVGLIPLFGKIADHGRLQGDLLLRICSVYRRVGCLRSCAGSSDAGNFPCGPGRGSLDDRGCSAASGGAADASASLGDGYGDGATTGAVALVFWPVLGGILTKYLSWHWCFFINVPVGIAAVVLGLRIIPRVERQPKVRFDLAGAVLIFTEMASLIYLLERGISLGWTSPQVIF